MCFDFWRKIYSLSDYHLANIGVAVISFLSSTQTANLIATSVCLTVVLATARAVSGLSDVTHHIVFKLEVV